MTDLDLRRRRAAYRAAHRGTKEMDWLLGRFAADRLAGMNSDDLTEFEQLMALPDPDLQTWIMAGGLPSDSGFADLIGRIRAFHDLGATAVANTDPATSDATGQSGDRTS